MGRTGAPPRLLTFDSDRTSLSFSVATNEIRISNGEPVESITQWNNVIVHESVPGYESLLKNLATGSLVYVEGNLRISKRAIAGGGYSQNVSIQVSRNHGVFRLLHSPESSTRSEQNYIEDDSASEDNIPF